jgi:hypothetical protein
MLTQGAAPIFPIPKEAEFYASTGHIWSSHGDDLGRGTDGAKPASGSAAGATARINWGMVLEQLPKRFRASQIRTVRGLKHKRPSEIFAAITRWMEAGAVKRKERGLYERVPQSQERRPE